MTNHGMSAHSSVRRILDIPTELVHKSHTMRLDYEIDITTMQDIARTIPAILIPLIFSPE